jgi:hypothetical protein
MLQTALANVSGSSICQFACYLDEGSTAEVLMSSIVKTRHNLHYDSKVRSYAAYLFRLEEARRFGKHASLAFRVQEWAFLHRLFSDPEDGGNIRLWNAIYASEMKGSLRSTSVKTQHIIGFTDTALRISNAIRQAWVGEINKKHGPYDQCVHRPNCNWTIGKEEISRE